MIRQAKTMLFWIFPLLFHLLCVRALDEKDKRPIYIIGHMVNSIDQLPRFLERGSNAVETDIQFYDNGTVKEIFHGIPCDCVRNCTRSASFTDYLDYVRTLSTGSGPYARKMIYQFFDLKLQSVNESYLEETGRDLADKIIDHLWGVDRYTKQVVRAIMYIASTNKNQTIESFIQRFAERGETELLKNVGFDGGAGAIDDIKTMWNQLGVNKNVVLGDGDINCNSPRLSDKKLREEVEVRDSLNGFIDIVYHWTIDDVTRMRLSLDIGVDGFITNTPELLAEVLTEPKYRDTLRVATFDDDPFAKFVPDTKLFCE